jgi:hypothetical protein
VSAGRTKTIESYSFGGIEVDGKRFTKDIIILPDGSVHHPWWRKSGHRLTLADIEPVLAGAPDILIVGTGALEQLVPDEEVQAELEAKGIAVRFLPTKEAVDEYNSRVAGGQKVAACLHLTC